MAAPPIVAVRSHNTTNALVARLVGGQTWTQLGGNCGTSNAETTDLLTTKPCDRGCQFGNDFYAWQQNVIYRYNPDTDAWDSAYTAPSMSTANGYGLHSGLYVVYVNDVPNLIGIYISSGSTTRYVIYNGSSWSSGEASASQYEVNGPVIVYKNTLFYTSWDQAKVHQFDPSAPSYTTYNVTGAGSMYTSVGEFFVHNNDLWYLGPLYPSGSTNLSAGLFKFSAGAFPLQQSLTGVVQGGGGNHVARAKWTVLNFGTDTIYAFITGTATGAAYYAGTYCIKLVWNGSSWTQTDKTDPVIPSALRAPVTGGNSAYEVIRWYVLLDIDTNPASPAAYLWFNSCASADSWVYYEWNGEGSVLSVAGTVGAYGIVMPMVIRGGGERVFSSGEPSVEITGKAKGSGGMEISFKAFGDPVILSHGTVTGTFSEGETVTGGISGATAVITRVNSSAQTLEVGNVQGGPFNSSETITTAGGSATTNGAQSGGTTSYTVKLFYDINQQLPDNQCTLTGGVTGGSASRNGNQIDSVTADGVIEYTTIWNFTGDGLSIGDFFIMMPRIAAS